MNLDLIMGNGVGMGLTPYGLIEQIKNIYGISSVHEKGVKYLLEFSMTINETFGMSSIDVLTACLMISESLKQTNLLWVM
jgi:hypothetical protein